MNRFPFKTEVIRSRSKRDRKLYHRQRADTGVFTTYEDKKFSQNDENERICSVRTVIAWKGVKTGIGPA